MTSFVSFGENIWVAEGPVVSFYGFPYATRMAIIRLTNGQLFVWSPIALNETLRAEGWTVLRFWDFEIEEALNRCADAVVEALALARANHSLGAPVLAV